MLCDAPGQTKLLILRQNSMLAKAWCCSTVFESSSRRVLASGITLVLGLQPTRQIAPRTTAARTPATIATWETAT